jgi:hypothetical protein
MPKMIVKVELIKIRFLNARAYLTQYGEVVQHTGVIYQDRISEAWVLNPVSKEVT